MDAEDGWRVKLYHLDDGNTWIDKGIGKVSFSENVVPMQSVLEVFSEEDNSTLLSTKICTEDIYVRQNESIILWSEEISSEVINFALSFQDVSGCEAVWSIIKAVQEHHRSLIPASNFIQFDVQVTPDSLSSIRDYVSGLSAIQKNEYACFLLQNDSKYLHKLVSLTDELDANGDIFHLQMLADIFRSIFLLNDPKLIEAIVSDELFLGISGAMEYDRHLQAKATYRAFLTSNVRMREVGKEQSHSLRWLCSMLFRLRLLKDHYIRPAIDEIGIGAVCVVSSHVIHSICQEVFRDKDYVDVLIRIIQNQLPAAESKDSGEAEAPLFSTKREDAVSFFRELFFLSRSLPVDLRIELYCQMLVDSGSESNALSPLGLRFFDAIRIVLQDPLSSQSERIHSSEILSSITVVYPQALRKVAIQGPCCATVSSCPKDVERNDNSLLFVIIRCIVEDCDAGVIEQLGDVMRVLLDSEFSNKTEKEKFLSLFYDYYLGWLLQPFADRNSPDQIISTQSRRLEIQSMSCLSTSRRIIFEILCTCVLSHTFRMKYYITRNNVIGKCNKIFDSPLTHLHLSCIRFLKTVIASKEESYLRQIVKNDYLRPLFTTFHNSAHRDNLINSAIFDVVEYIRIENMRILVAYIVDNFSAYFEDVATVDSFERLKAKYDQNNAGTVTFEKESDKGTVELYGRYNKQFVESESEEAYLMDDADAAKGAGPGTSGHSSSLALLSDLYGDDDENEEGVSIGPKTNDEEIPLPPLKSKFEVDDSDCGVFRKGNHESKFSDRVLSSEFLNERQMLGVAASKKMKEPPTGSGGGVFFAMKKRSKLT